MSPISWLFKGILRSRFGCIFLVKLMGNRHISSQFMSNLHSYPSWQIAAALFLLLILAIELGYWIGRRLGKPSEESNSALNTVKGALLALVGLLLGFSYSMASTRFETRKAMLIQEANAIGTAYLRGDLFDEVRREPYRELLRRYTDARLAFFRMTTDAEAVSGALQPSEALQNEIWKLGMEQARANPLSPNNLLIVDSLNAMIDTGTERVAARQNEVPQPIIVLLIVSTFIAGLFIGHSFGIGRRRSWLATFGFAFVISLVVFVILDLDQPRRGSIRISQEVMVQLRSSMK